jgi:CHAD domain-containing protein
MKLEFVPNEGASSGLRRIALELADSAQARLDIAAPDLGKAIHDARKDCKKLRAAVRLGRAIIEREAYERCNLAVRDAARLLAGPRDAQVVLETLQQSEAMYRGATKRAPLVGLQAGLRQTVGKAASGTSKRQMGRLFRELHRRFGALRGEIEAWGTTFRDFGAIEPGLRATYRSGREYFQLCQTDPSTENLHEWRKQVKYLWHQLEFLHPLWPLPLGALAEELHKLSGCLGNDHDYAVLSDLVTAEAGLGTAEERKELARRVERRRTRLIQSAMALGARLYADKPRNFSGRLAACWKAWHREPRPSVKTVAPLAETPPHA